VKKIGLALGGGGVRGLAHALVLEALDEMGCRPSVIAGTSIGAIMGALYASGVPGKTVRENIQKNIFSRRELLRNIMKKRSDLMIAVRTVAFERGRGGIVKPDQFLNFLLSIIHKTTFEELDIPLVVIAADYWSGEEVILETGELLPALKASMAIPGVFAPAMIGDRVLMDGGIVDLVPYEHIVGRCDISIAVDVTGTRTPKKQRVPNVWEAVTGSLEIMQEATLAERLKRSAPDVFVHPDILDVPFLDFSKAARVLRQSAPAIEKMKKAIENILAHS
jgi:NTE family protein